LAISVIVATFGDRKVWDQYAERALASINRQSRYPDEVIRIHDIDLRTARNTGVEQSNSEFVVILDADDELDEFYLDAMLLAKGDLRYPRILKIYPDGSEEFGQGLCIGTMFRREDFLGVGGFGPEPILEDLALWTRMKKTAYPSLSIYRAYIRPGSRNSNEELKDEWASKILSW
jgi:glycosyltransferase involved in cell wall biosynthesis